MPFAAFTGPLVPFGVIDNSFSGWPLCSPPRLVRPCHVKPYAPMVFRTREVSKATFRTRRPTSRRTLRGKRPTGQSGRHDTKQSAANTDLGSAERLQKVMSRMGVASRRNSEQLIADGKVSVNGKQVKELGTLVDVRNDRIVVNGKALERPGRPIWIAVHKPPGYLSLPKEGFGRSVVDLVPKSKQRGLLPVGNIEEDFSGLVVMTNERGSVPDLARPDNPHIREWLVEVEGFVTDNDVAPLRRGVEFSGERTKSLPADIDILASGKVELEDRKRMMITQLEVRVRESKHHLIRRLFESVQVNVIRARRKRFGPILLGSLKRGYFRYLTPNEVKALKRGVANVKSFRGDRKA